MSDRYTDLEGTIQLYVLGRLSESEMVAFEDYFFTRPEVAEQVATMQEMVRGFKNSSFEFSAFNKKNEVQRSLREPGLFSRIGKWLASPVPVFGPALAFTAVGMIVGSNFLPKPNMNEVSVVKFSTQIQRSSMTQSSTSEQLVPGPIDSLEIDLRQYNKPTMVFLKVAKPIYRRYVIEVKDRGTGAELWRSEEKVLGGVAGRELSVMVPNKLSGRVILTVSGAAESGSNVEPVKFCNYAEVCTPVKQPNVKR